MLKKTNHPFSGVAEVHSDTLHHCEFEKCNLEREYNVKKITLASLGY